jgi:uncharacterized membrane protein YqiK
MNGADIIAIIILAAIVIAVAVYLLHWLYRHSSKDLSFVRTGLGGEKIVMGGGAFVLPIVHDITEVSMNTLRIEVRRHGEKSLITKNRMRIEVSVEFFVRVIPTDEAVAAAARTLGNRTLNPESLRDLVQGRFVDAMSSVAAKMTMEEIHENRSEYVKGVKTEVAAALTKNGLELEAASFTSLDQADIKMFNPSNAFDAEGLTRLTEEIESRKKKRNDIEQDTMIAIRKKNLESEKLTLSIDQESEYSRLEQEREVAMRRAQQRAEVARERVDREREIEEAQLRAKEAIEKIRLQQESAIEAEAILQNLETQKLDIQRRRALDMENQDRLVAVAVNEAEGQTRLTYEVESRKKKRNDIEQDTVIAIRQKSLETEKTTISIDKEIELWRIEEDRALSVRRVQQRAEVSLERTEREQEIEEAEIKSKETVHRSRIRAELAVVTEQINREQEAERLEVLRRRVVELEEQDRIIAIAQKSIVESEARTSAEASRALMAKAEEHVISTREKEIAERRKAIELIVAAQHAEREAIKLVTQASAEKDAAKNHAEADRSAADAAKYRYEVDSEGQRKLNEAENVRSDRSRQSALQAHLIQQLPSIIRESVKPMENIDSIKILHVDGLPGLSGGQQNGAPGNGGDQGEPGGNEGSRSGSLADNVVSSALRYRAQAPFVDNLLSEIGMSPNSMTNLGGLESMAKLEHLKIVNENTNKDDPKRKH